MYLSNNLQYVLVLTFVLTSHGPPRINARYYTKAERLKLREQVRGMFQHAYDGYLRHASEFDELRPLTCDGVDTWGSYSLTLIDSLDTLATMGNFTEFRRVALLLETKIDFNKDINVSVFETNIRIVGGLLSAHLLSKRAGLELETGWPCQGPLLRLAEDIAKRLLPAFDTKTGMPYGTVNLRHGVPKGETSVTCTAGVGTFLVEFGTLSRLTGNSIYEEVALNAAYALWERRSSIGLFGNHIDVQTGRWTAIDSGIGAGVDSYFEYLVKASILLNRPELLELFHEARQSIDKYLKRNDWYVWANMNKGQMTLPVFQSLEAFWPSIISIIGDINPAMRTLSKYSSVWRQYGFLPEFYNIIAGEASQNRESYPLRPELAESIMYLYRATNDHALLEMGERIVESIDFSAKTKCGYATIRNVVTHEKQNRMESFFLAETTKYLYLLFDEENFLHNNAATGERLLTPHGECVIHAGAYIFNTEAHPIDMSALYCCHDIQEDIYDGLDLKLFIDDALLKQDRERYIAKAAQNPKYECTGGKSDAKSRPPATTNPPHSNISVDIEVFDDQNNPADDVLIENFEKIKFQSRAEGEHTENMLLRNQLTVNDLEDFFDKDRSHFHAAQDALDYVRNFMQNYTLDAIYIRDLQIFDKSMTAALGAAVQKEYEAHMRTLWDLYELKQLLKANIELSQQLGLSGFEQGDTTHITNVLKALKHSEEPVEMEELHGIYESINRVRSSFEERLVNTTAMQEFLWDILINGSSEKKRSLKLLLSSEEVRTMPVPTLELEKRQLLFSNVRRIAEIKKRMIETFAKLQALMQESEVAETKQKATTKAPSDDAKESIDEPKQTQAESAKTSADNATKETSKPSANDSDGSSDSVWSQLVQRILRKTNLQSVKFDENELQLKTRMALQKYANKTLKYELFVCEEPNFTHRFHHGNYYP